MTHRVDDALVEALRSATRINAPYDADPSCRIVGFILPQAIAWPESGTAIDIPRVLLSAALEAAGVAELREALRTAIAWLREDNGGGIPPEWDALLANQGKAQADG